MFEKEFQEILLSFEEKMSSYELQRAVDEEELVIYVINDAVVLAATPCRVVVPRLDFGPIMHSWQIYWEELSPNTSNIVYAIKGVRRFNGLDRYYDPPRLSLYEYADRYPHLRILERYEAWNGIPNSIILVEMDVKD